ncbi:hypothetical protein V8C35DRAFT_458 [Trichoderma chlorosporum]
MCSTRTWGAASSHPYEVVWYAVLLLASLVLALARTLAFTPRERQQHKPPSRGSSQWHLIRSAIQTPSSDLLVAYRTTAGERRPPPMLVLARASIAAFPHLWLPCPSSTKYPRLSPGGCKPHSTLRPWQHASVLDGRPPSSPTRS